jgi:hypothetical protein
MRYLYTTADDQLFAHAPGRRDFFKEGDDRVWAHESHGYLIAAQSGQTLAHRTGDVYYGAVDGERLYRVSTEPDSPAPAKPVARTHRGPQRAVRPS